jgi:hypothetical protein
VSGWDTRFQLHTGTSVSGTVRATTSSGGASDFPVEDPAPAGTQRSLISSAWTVTP